MNNQEQNREALIEHIAEQDRIIRRRNQQIENQAQNARESQRAIEEQDARNNSLAADLASAVVRADKAERERDSLRAEVVKAKMQAKDALDDDITDEMVIRARRSLKKGTGYDYAYATVLDSLTAALTEPPRPEDAEEWDRRPFDAVHDVLARTDLSHLSTQGKTAALYSQGVRVMGAN